MTTLPTLPYKPETVVKVARPMMPDEEKRIIVPLDLILAAVERRLTPAIRQEVNDKFGAYLGQPQYPALVGNQLIDMLCSTCLSDLPLAEARQVFGRYYVARHAQTFFGHFLQVAASLVSIDWVVRRLPYNFAAATNFGTYWVAEIAPKHWRLDFEDDPGYPEMILGELLTGIELLKARVEVTYSVPEPKHMSFSLKWD